MPGKRSIPAVALLSAVLALAGCRPVEVGVLYAEATAAAEAGEFSTAIDLTRRCLDAKPDAVNVLILHGFCSYMTAHSEKDRYRALGYLRRAADLAPESFLAQYFYGWLLCEDGQFSPAMEPLERAYELKEGYTEFVPDLLVLLGRCCVENNLPKGRSYLQALRRYRAFADSPEVYNALGNLARKQGEYADALMWFAEALDKDPGNAVVLQNMAVLYDVYLGQPDRARQFYVRSLAARQQIRDITNQAEIRERLKQLRAERLRPAPPTP